MRQPQDSEVALWGAGAGGAQDHPAEMALLTEDVEQELSATAQQVLGKLWSHQLFQSEWDTGAFIIFLVFLGECGLASGPRQPPRPRAISGYPSCPQASWRSCCWSSASIAAAVAAAKATPPGPGR